MSIYLDRYIRGIKEARVTTLHGETPVHHDGKQIGSVVKDKEGKFTSTDHKGRKIETHDSADDAISKVKKTYNNLQKELKSREFHNNMKNSPDKTEKREEWKKANHPRYTENKLHKLKEETIEEADKKVTWVSDNDGNDIGYIEKHQGRYKNYYHAKDKKGKLISVHKFHDDAYNAVEVNHSSSK